MDWLRGLCLDQPGLGSASILDCQGGVWGLVLGGLTGWEEVGGCGFGGSKALQGVGCRKGWTVSGLSRLSFLWI